jgi:hypothetical protein
MRRKYMYKADFEEFLANDFWHLRMEVRAHTWLLLLVLATMLGTVVARFYFGG